MTCLTFSALIADSENLYSNKAGLKSEIQGCRNLFGHYQTRTPTKKRNKNLAISISETFKTVLS